MRGSGHECIKGGEWKRVDGGGRVKEGGGLKRERATTLVLRELTHLTDQPWAPLGLKPTTNSNRCYTAGCGLAYCTSLRELLPTRYKN